MSVAFLNDISPLFISQIKITWRWEKKDFDFNTYMTHSQLLNTYVIISLKQSFITVNDILLLMA